jgi:GT2 family glycosyltransferase
LEARRSNAVIVYCRAQFVDRSGVLLERFWGRPLSGDWRDYFEFSWQTMCALYSRQALESIGFWNEDLIISQDWEFCIRAVISGQSVEYHDEVGALYMSEGDDRIGSSLNSRKHRGRELALWSVHAYLENRGLMCSKIRGRFRSRFLHILISYRVCGESVLAANLLEQMAVANVLPGRLVGILGVVPNRWLAGFIVGRFDRLQASARSSIR